MRRFIACTVATASFAAASIAPGGELFLLGNVPYSYAIDLSADGRVAVGYDQVSAWYWTRETWVVRLEESRPPGNGVGGHPNITADGRYITCSTLQGTPPKTEATIYDRELNTYDPAVGSFGFNCGHLLGRGQPVNRSLVNPLHHLAAQARHTHHVKVIKVAARNG